VPYTLDLLAFPISYAGLFALIDLTLPTGSFAGAGCARLPPVPRAFPDQKPVPVPEFMLKKWRHIAN